MTSPNPNFPLVLWEVDWTKGPPNVVSTARMSINAPVRRTAVQTADLVRGRQYELDQVPAGTANIHLTDPLEILHPDNATSPFNTSGNAIKPYRALQVAALWPTAPGSGNLINTGVSSSYDPSFETTVGGWTAVGGTTTRVVSSAQAFAGTKSMLVTQSAAGSGFGVFQQFPTGPGVAYVFSVYVYPTAGVTVQAKVVTGSGATVTSATASTASTWTRLTLAWTSVDTLEDITIWGTGTSTPTFYVDATQLEWGSTPTAFTTSGPTLYQVYNGYLENFPLEWDMAGHRGQRPLTAVDALAVLSRTVINQSYAQTLLADGPAIYIPYNDPGFPQTVQRPTGGQPPIPYQQLGSNSAAVSFAGDNFLDGSPAVSIAQQNTDPPTVLDNTQTTYLGTRAGALSASPVALTLEAWVKFVRGNVFVGMGAMQPGESTIGAVLGTAKGLWWYTSGGRLGVNYDDPNGNGTPVVYLFNSATSWLGDPDGVWHHIAITMQAAYALGIWVDGVLVRTATPTGPWSPAVSFDNFYAMTSTYYGEALGQLSVANLAVFTSILNSGQFTTHYQRGVGYINEVSGARVTRLLTQYWAGPKTVAAGYAAMAPDHEYNGRTLLDCLQEIQETERGLLYVSRAGTVIFEDRVSRYASSNQVALWTLGENPAGASPTEYPYIEYKASYDPTYTFSQANLTRPGNSTATPQINATTQTDYGQRIVSQTVQVNTDFDVQQAGIYYLTRYAKPKTRIVTLTLDPSANPALWPVVLSLEISQRITVKRRTQALTTSADYYIEAITHHISATTGVWTVDLQASPVFVSTAWILGDSTYGVLGTTTVPVY